MRGLVARNLALHFSQGFGDQGLSRQLRSHGVTIIRITLFQGQGGVPVFMEATSFRWNFLFRTKRGTRFSEALLKAYFNVSTRVSKTSY